MNIFFYECIFPFLRTTILVDKNNLYFSIKCCIWQQLLTNVDYIFLPKIDKYKFKFAIFLMY